MLPGRQRPRVSRPFVPSSSTSPVPCDTEGSSIGSTKIPRQSALQRTRVDSVKSAISIASGSANSTVSPPLRHELPTARRKTVLEKTAAAPSGVICASIRERG